MEKRDLYDNNRNFTGLTINKGDTIPSGMRIVVVMVFIQNSKGEFLIQKRALRKDNTYATTGGHPKSGESSIEGMITEIKEELGLSVNRDELTFFHTDYDDEVFCDLYYLKKDIDIKNLILQKEEVDFVEWDSLDDIYKLIENNLFKYSNIEEFGYCLDYLNIKHHLNDYL